MLSTDPKSKQQLNKIHQDWKGRLLPVTSSKKQAHSYKTPLCNRKMINHQRSSIYIADSVFCVSQPHYAIACQEKKRVNTSNPRY